MKKELTEAGTFDAFQELLRNNLIRVDVGTIENGNFTCVSSKRLHRDLYLELCTLRFDLCPAQRQTSDLE